MQALGVVQDEESMQSVTCLVDQDHVHHPIRPNFPSSNPVGAAAIENVAFVYECACMTRRCWNSD